MSDPQNHEKSQELVHINWLDVFWHLAKYCLKLQDLFQIMHRFHGNICSNTNWWKWWSLM